ncbi:MAG TPA: glycoside hydrolase family 19 protein [Chloroflexota bacterium]|jgi:predicted chitinase
MARCTNCPQLVIEANWPAIYAELERCGIASPEVQAGALSTIAIETARTFAPVREAYWMSEDWRAENLRYSPYYGRGYIQLTWDYNYQSYGQIVAQPLLEQPDLALEEAIAASVFAEFFGRSGAAAAAQRCDWTECRRRVQGGSAGLDELKHVCACLGYP